MKKLTQIDLYPPGGYDIPTRFDDTSSPGVTLANIISAAIGIISVVAAIWFVFRIITSGIAIMNAGGDQGKITEARKTITNSMIGLIVTIFGTIFVAFIGRFLGFDILDLENAFTSISNF